MTEEAPTAWQADPLPRGRHKLSRDAVRASQRERLLGAMAEVVSAEGYEATTVPKVVAAARVSTNAFYEQFKDKADCFIALCEMAGDALFTEMASFATETDWLTSLDKGMDFYLRWWQQQPALTRAYMIELPAAGRRAQDERERQHERFLEVVRYLAEWARRTDPDLPPASKIALDAAVDAPTDLVGREVRADRLEQLHELKDELTDLLIRLIADDSWVARHAERAGA